MKMAALTLTAALGWAYLGSALMSWLSFTSGCVLAAITYLEQRRDRRDLPVPARGRQDTSHTRLPPAPRGGSERTIPLHPVRPHTRPAPQPRRR